MNRKFLLSVFVLLSGVTALVAAPVSQDEARRAVGRWLKTDRRFGSRIRGNIAHIKSHRLANGAAFHVVTLSEGGSVVTSADTGIEPVIAFSSAKELKAGEGSPLRAMLERDLASRSRRRVKLAAASKPGAVAPGLRSGEMKWAELLAEASTEAVGGARAVISDVRVAPLVRTRWAQEDAGNLGYGEPCYNYYTPDHRPCGCVATAGGQLMRYHRHPAAAVTPASFECEKMVDGVLQPVMLTMQGGVYDWDAMPENPAEGVTEAQRQAIGRLTSDVGIACYTTYTPYGSGAQAYSLVPALATRFGYSDVAVAVYADTGMDIGTFKRAVIPNMDAHLPVMVGIRSTAGGNGHAALVDGYGYSGDTFFVHFNFGWAEADDVWYAPPDLGEYDSVDSIVYNIHPTGEAGCSIVSGRVLSPSGLPLGEVEVKATGAGEAVTVTDSRGIWALRLKPGSYMLTATSGAESAQRSLGVGACVSTEIVEWSYRSTPAPVVGNQAGIDFTLGTEPVTYTIEFRDGGGSGTMESVRLGKSEIASLPRCAFKAPAGKRFAGWRHDVSARRFDDGVLVFALASPGATVTLTAIWE